MRTIIGVAAIIALVVLGYALAIPNYQECRGAGYSARYCALTHLVR